MRTSEMQGTFKPSVDIPRAIERMTRGDFRILLDRSAKLNNARGIMAEYGRNERMVMDDTEMAPGIVHWLIYHAVHGNLVEMNRLSDALRAKYTKSTGEEIAPIKPQVVVKHRGNNELNRVRDIQPDGQTVAESLGITPERADELCTMVVTETEYANVISTIISNVSKECVHPNEVAYVSFVVGCTAIATKRQTT